MTKINIQSLLLTGLIGTFLFIGSMNAQMPAMNDNAKPIDTQNFDASVKPADDFYQYANGGWMARNPIPGDQSRWGSFNEVNDRNQKILREILEDAAKRTDAPKRSNLQKVGDFYASGMDTVKIEADGIKPLMAEFDRIDAMKNATDLQNEIAHLHTMNVRVPFVFFVSQDAKQSTEIVAHLSQSGLGLPDRDYYTKEDDNSKQLREKYISHLNKMFELLGDDATAAAANARTVMTIETRLAKASMTRVARRDPDSTYHKMKLSDLSQVAPHFGWNGYFTNLGLPNPKYIIVGMPNFLNEISSMVNEVPLKDWKTYLRWHIINGVAEFLSTPFVNQNFEFRGKALTGARELRPRWKRCLETVDGEIGEALGQLYVDKAFGGPAKARAKELVENLRSALRDRIKELDWMSEATKQQALRKLNAFTVKIGYPDVWRDYSKLKIDRSSYVQNIINAEMFEFKRNLDQVGKPVDRTEWGMTPPTVNAYYNPTMNEIVFPAGILQPPFFDANADDAVNYGGIGAVIGHEMTHGFDDQGRKFDADGNLKDWWTEEDGKNYTSRASIVEHQFNGYQALDTMHVNGKLTLGENIADLGGLTIAYLALQKSFEKNGRPEAIDGFTAEQRFFLSFAQIWRQNIRPEALRLRLNTDPHSPGRFRCIGTISNMIEFQKAFDLPEGSPMVRAQKAKIW